MASIHHSSTFLMCGLNDRVSLNFDFPLKIFEKWVLYYYIKNGFLSIVFIVFPVVNFIIVSRIKVYPHMVQKKGSSKLDGGVFCCFVMCPDYFSNFCRLLNFRPAQTTCWSYQMIFSANTIAKKYTRIYWPAICFTAYEFAGWFCSYQSSRYVDLWCNVTKWQLAFISVSFIDIDYV